MGFETLFVNGILITFLLIIFPNVILTKYQYNQFVLFCESFLERNAPHPRNTFYAFRKSLLRVFVA